MGWTQAIEALAILALALALCYRPLGDYMAWVLSTSKHWRVERAAYRLCGVNPAGEQPWQAYLRAVLVFSGAGLVLLFILQKAQPLLPGSQGHGSIPSALAFNTAASFVGNTNWQAYSPELTTGYLVPMTGLAVQMFLSAAVGIAVSIALVRGFTVRRTGTLGNFWVDLVRINTRILLPLAVLAGVVLMAGGVIQNFNGADITTVSGGTQSIPGGPVASQQAISMLGTNGGGFFNASNAHPFATPSGWINLFQIFLLLVIPFALPRTFGALVGDRRLGYTLLATMAVLFLIVFFALTAAELAGHGGAPQLAGAAMEGKEQRIGIPGSSLFGTATTGTSGGAANSMHGSYTALGGLVLMLNMLLGEVSPGGVGAGLYTILVLVIITVFLTGLLLGRAPIFLGKRIGPRQMKIAGAFILVMPTLALGGLTISLLIPPIHSQIIDSMSEAGPHGMSEAMYAFISAAINNGSAFSGFNADTTWLNVALGIIILAGRFIPIALALALAGSFATQDEAPSAAAELPVRKPQFVALLCGMIIFIALPMFIPYLLVGPFADGML